MCIVSAKRVMSGLPMVIASAIWCHHNSFISVAAAWVIVVDEDVDPTNFNEVIWAMTTRCDPQRGVQIIKDRGTALALVPVSPWVDRAKLHKGGSSIMIDAGFPYDWRISDPENVPDVLNFESWPEEVRNRALKILKEK
jgi:UbiD family decarboxylase